MTKATSIGGFFLAATLAKSYEESRLTVIPNPFGFAQGRLKSSRRNLSGDNYLKDSSANLGMTIATGFFPVLCRFFRHSRFRMKRKAEIGHLPDVA
ncbi:MAG: hypothetical protein AAF614_08155 [Chloroflexota bacterium]